MTCGSSKPRCLRDDSPDVRDGEQERELKPSRASPKARNERAVQSIGVRRGQGAALKLMPDVHYETRSLAQAASRA